MRWWLVILALAGCDKIWLTENPLPPADAAPDSSANGHDEDNDGIADVADNCPHIKGPQTDDDGDGVGDPCDPNPDALDKIAAFYGFDTSSPMFQAVAGSWNVTGDMLVHVGTDQFSKYVARGGLVLTPPYVIDTRFKFDDAPDYAEFSISASLDTSDFGSFCTILFQPTKTEIHAYTPGHDAVTPRMPPLDRMATFTARMTVTLRSVRCAITSSTDGDVAAMTGSLVADVGNGPAGFEGRHGSTTTEYMVIYTPRL